MEKTIKTLFLLLFIPLISNHVLAQKLPSPAKKKFDRQCATVVELIQRFFTYPYNDRFDQTEELICDNLHKLYEYAQKRYKKKKKKGAHVRTDTENTYFERIIAALPPRSHTLFGRISDLYHRSKKAREILQDPQTRNFYRKFIASLQQSPEGHSREALLASCPDAHFPKTRKALFRFFNAVKAL